MADKDKSAKLAAAKKRLKKFQSQQQDAGSEQTPVPSNDGSVSDQPSEQSGTVDHVTEVREVAAVPTPPIATLLDLLAAQIDTAGDRQSKPHPPTANGSPDELAVERQRNHDLSAQLLQQNEQIEQLRVQVQQLNVENNSKVTAAADTAPLHQQLQSHVQTIGVLVGEKAELAAALAKFQSLAREKITEVEELQGRLNASRHRVQVLEKDTTAAKTASDRFAETQQKLCSELEHGQEQLKQKQRQLDELNEECGELRRSLARRTAETDALRTDQHDMRAQLSLAQLRVEQFTAGDDGCPLDDSKIEQLAAQSSSAERQVVELQHVLQQVGAERDQANQQYQNYVHTLNQEMGEMAQRLQSCVADNERLAQREESLVRHVGELERQMQQQMAKQKNFQQSHHEANWGASAECAEWTARVAALEVARTELSDSLLVAQQNNAELMVKLGAAQSELEHLASTLDRVQSEQPDAKSLNATMESDKVAASRAVAQNVELKKQLEEIQRAFVTLSNDKLELTDRLQSEQHLGRENKHSVQHLQEQLDAIRQKLHFKDEEMIRLSHENEEVKKESLQLAMEIDRLRHYEARVQSAAVVQQQSDDQIRRLRNKISRLETTAAGCPVDIPNDTPNGDNIDANIGDTEDDSDVVSTSAASSSIKTIATEEAMDRLQERFQRTMSDHANLTEEKFRLEHLVLQLQDETNTIGDYITLYHKQRQLLKQRESEKDVQLKHIVQDREAMHTKLVQLNGLVEQLMRQQLVTTETVPIGDGSAAQTNGNVIDLPPSDDPTNTFGTISAKPNAVRHSKTSETTTQILHLLTEIQDQNQTLDNQPLPLMEKCACCYGQLKVV